MKNVLLLISFLFLSHQTTFSQTKNIWATATRGGSMGYGTILMGDSDANNFQVVHNFDSLNGSYPIGKMAVAGNGKIYCVTELGGCDDSCSIGCWDTTTKTYTMIYQFMLNEMYGAVPMAGVIVAGNGLIYGTTASGGAYNYGCIYSIDPSTNLYSDVLDFNDSIVGESPMSELFEGNNGKIYGIASAIMYTQGQTSSPIPAILFSFDPLSREYAHIATLGVSGVSLSYTQYPSFDYRSPNLIQASDNKIYGMFMIEDPSFPNQTGSLFSYDFTTGTYTDLHDLTPTDGYPQGGLIQAANGKIYGTTTGIPGICAGGIFSYNPATTVFSVLRNYDSITGIYPAGGLNIFDDNKLAGSTSAGGAHGAGVLYTYDITNNTFQDIFDFDSTTTGTGPQCDILKTGFKSITGIPTVTNASLTIYPNPASDFLYVQNAPPNTTYNITNTLGQQIQKGVITGACQAIDISQLPAGNYLLNGAGFVKE